MKKIIFSILILITLIAVGADKKITDLTLLSSGSFATGDTIPIVDVSANETKKTTIGQLDNRYASIITPGNVSTSTSGVTVGSGTSATVGPNVTINIQTASGSGQGLLSASDWSTFNGKESALTFSAPLSRSVNTISCIAASGSVDGCLSSADWTTFNSKQAAGNYITALTGDGTASGPGSAAFTLANTSVVAGSYTTANITVDSKGRITSAANGTAGISALTGDVTASGTGSVAATVANVGGKTASQVGTSVDDTLAATSANTASVIVKRDSSKNFLINNVGTTTTSTTTSNNATLTLTVSSSRRQRLGGTGTNYKVKLPDATTLGQTGFSFYIDNRSSQDISVIDNGSNVLYTVPTLSAASVIASSIGSSNGTWEIETAIGQPATDSASGYFSAGDHATLTSTNSTVSARTSANTASAIAARSSDGNIWTTGAFQKMTTTATAAGTTTLTVASSPIQIWTGTTTQTIKMPAANTLVQVGTTYKLINQSTGTLTIQDNSAGAITTIVGGMSADITVTNIGSAAGTWTSTQYINTLSNPIGTVPLSNGGTGQTTKAAAFDALSPMTASGDIIYGGASGTGTKLTKGTDGQVLKLASGLPTWSTDSTGSGTSTYRAVSTTDSTTSSDTVIALSGASFTLTLHTAVGNTGQLLELKHLGTSISQVYTLNTTSAQTIGGIASGSYKLTTNQEKLKLISDGTNWQILDHYARTPLSSCVATTLTASGTAPVKGTMGTDCIYWERDGRYAQVFLNFRQTGAGTANSGTYGYRVTLPGSLSADTSAITVNTSTDATGSWGQGTLFGECAGNLGTSGGFMCKVQMYDSTTFRMAGDIGSGGYGIWGLSNTLGNTTVNMTAHFRVPITDWQP